MLDEEARAPGGKIANEQGQAAWLQLLAREAFELRVEKRLRHFALRPASDQLSQHDADNRGQ